MSRLPDPHAKIDLLRAAEAVFVERGLDQAKVEEITARAGRSKGAFYLHFDSKETAFRQIVESLIARLAELLDDSAMFDLSRGKHLDREALLAHWRDKDVEIFEFMWQNRRVGRLIMEGGKSAAYAYLAEEFAERCRVDTMRKLEWGVQQKLFRADLDIELASLVLSGAYDRVTRALMRAERKPDFAALAVRLQHLMMAGLAHASVARLFDSSVKNK
jgi:AcrR family transcriptional regulator